MLDTETNELKKFEDAVKELTKNNIKFSALHSGDIEIEEAIINEMYTIKRGSKESIKWNNIDKCLRLYRIARISINLKKSNPLFAIERTSDGHCVIFECKNGKKINIKSNTRYQEITEKKFDVLVYVATDAMKSGDEDPCWKCYEKNKVPQKIYNDTMKGKSFSELCKELESLLGKSNKDVIKGKSIEDKQIIYYGPPGTGKTRKAKIEAVKIVTGNNCSDIDALNLFEGRINNKGTNEEKENDKKNIEICEEQIQIVQFHPSYSYNEFMETIDARGINKDGVFKKIANDARNHPDKKYVLIIDEINRANVSEVLGELLYGIEYRGQEITTGISNDDFSVPENLYIIGTMNTADRSLQALDYAVRRRFTFKKVKAELPDPKPPEQKEDVKDKGCYEIENGHFFCQNVFKKVQEDVMKSVARGIDPEDIMPGISYFLVNGKDKKSESDPDSYDEEHRKYKMKYELIPLLREYAKNGMFTKRKKLDINGKSLVELLYDNTYFEYLENNLSESEKK